MKLLKGMCIHGVSKMNDKVFYGIVLDEKIPTVLMDGIIEIPVRISISLIQSLCNTFPGFINKDGTISEFYLKELLYFALHNSVKINKKLKRKYES